MIQTLTGALGLGAHDPSFWMPLVLIALFYVIVVAATVLDGFDIGVGCLLPFAPASARARMLALLSPWRDANEFWFFLGLGLLASAFPHAWAPIMGALYGPLTLLACGALLRSACFELRLRSPLEWQHWWNYGIAGGAWLTAIAHGLILGAVVTAYAPGVSYSLLGLFFALASLAAYCLLGASWLVMREPGTLRARAARWARRSVRWTAAGIVAVSIVLMLVNSGVFTKWVLGLGSGPIAAIWGGLLGIFVMLELILQAMMSRRFARAAAVPFLLVLLMFFILLAGLGYSFFPYLVLDNVTIWDAAASPSALRLVLSGTVIALPVAVIFNVWVYRGMFGLSRPPEPPTFTG